MRLPPLRGFYLLWPAIIVAAGLALHVFDLGGIVSRVQSLSLIAFERSWPRTETAPPPIAVRYVDIDAESISANGPWPWPRSDLARLIERFAADGARLVVLDIPLDEKDPTAPQRSFGVLPPADQAPALRSALDALPDPDQSLATAMGRMRVVTRISLSASGTNPTDLTVPGLDQPSPRILKGLPHTSGMRPPLPLFVDASAGIGVAPQIRADVVALATPLAYAVGNRALPALELEVTRLALDDETASLNAGPRETNYERMLGRPGLATVMIGARRIPVTRRGELWSYPLAAGGPPALSASRVLGGEGAFRDTVVVLGASAAPTTVMQRNPLGRSAAPTALLAERIQQLLAGAAIERPIWAEAGEQLFMLVCGIAICLLLGHAPLNWSIATGAIAIGGATYVGAMGFSREALFLDPLFPSLVIGAALAVGITMRRRRSIAEAEELLSPRGFAGAAQPARGNARTESGERPVTVMVCDIPGFDDLIPRYAVHPAALARLVRRYEETMSEIIVRNKGSVALTRGGQLFAAWNAAQADPEHASNACASALRMIDVLERLNATLADDAKAHEIAFVPLTLSIGINTGDALISPHGPGTRSELIPVGATVALAEALEHCRSSYGPAPLVSETTQAEAQKLFALLEIDFLRLPGREGAGKLYALLGNPLIKASPRFRALQSTHDEIFNAYRARNWTLARALLRECRKLPGALPEIYELYEARIASFEESPPAPEWDGAHGLEAA